MDKESVEELYFSFHVNKVKRQFFLSEEQPLEDFQMESVLSSHAYSIYNRLLNLPITFHSKNIVDEDALKQMQFGFGRRVQVIYYIWRDILFEIFPPGRDCKFDEDEKRRLEININYLYINISGALDNLTLSYLYEREKNFIRDQNLNSINLFNKKFLNKTNQLFKKNIVDHKEWFKCMKEIRNPIAHRLPFYVPNIVSDQNKNEHEKRTVNYLNLLNSNNIEEAEKELNKVDELENLGTFFYSGENNKFYPIYPTIPNDISHLLRIYYLFEEYLHFNK